MPRSLLATVAAVLSAAPAPAQNPEPFVAALRADGMVAPTVIDGPVTGDLFVTYRV